MKAFVIGVVGVAILAVTMLAVRSLSGPQDVKKIEAEVVKVYPHDAKAFTQGLLWHNGKLYEGTGREGISSVRILDLESKDGTPAKLIPIDDDLFGEGIAIWEDRLIQLTWKDRLVIIYDKDSLKEIERRRLDLEGWGLTNDDESLILSDGSSTIRFLDPDDFSVKRMIDVTMNGRRLREINELEYANGFIYANVWHEDYVVKISPKTGEVVGKIELGSLIPASQRTRDEVLNGIAYDPENDCWFVTGKLWPKMFEIKLKD